MKHKTPLIVAELSANHNQSLALAKDSIRAIKQCGADAIKLQTYTPESLTLKADSAYFRIKGGTLWDDSTLYDLYQKARTPLEWHKELFALARDIGLLCFSSPFSPQDVAFLESMQCPMYKVASFEIAYEALIQSIAKTKKPIIISTGIATHKEIKNALEICLDYHCNDITLLTCTSEYPAPLDAANLRSMPLLAKTYKKYGVKYGLSDHTQGALCPIIATSLGAYMIEKHFILSKTLGGVDSAFSMSKDEFATMVSLVRQTSSALGDKKVRIDKRTMAKRRVFARSIFSTKTIKKGDVLTQNNIAVVRPNSGLHPRFFKRIIGKKAKCDIPACEPLKRAYIKGI